MFADSSDSLCSRTDTAMRLPAGRALWPAAERRCSAAGRQTGRGICRAHLHRSRFLGLIAGQTAYVAPRIAQTAKRLIPLEDRACVIRACCAVRTSWAYSLRRRKIILTAQVAASRFTLCHEPASCEAGHCLDSHCGDSQCCRPDCSRSEVAGQEIRAVFRIKGTDDQPLGNGRNFLH